MNNFRTIRRGISALVLLSALAFTGGCFSIGFSGHFGHLGGSLGASISGLGRLTGSNMFRYGAYWSGRGVFSGIRPGSYLATSIRESMANDNKAPEEFSPEQQYYIGRGVSASLINEFKMANLDDPKVRLQLKYLNLMAGFVNVSAPDGAGLWAGLHIGLLESPKVGAYATPGGFIWISRGTLDLVQSEDELAAIICHEMGHVAKEHAIKAYVKDGGGQVKPNPFIKNLGMLSPLPRVTGNYFGSLAERVANNKYGKDQEFEADKWGAVSLQLAGYDAQAMVRMLKRVEAYEGKHADKGAYLANHPEVKDRVARLQDFFDDDKDMFKVTISADAKARRAARFKAVFGR